MKKDHYFYLLIVALALLPLLDFLNPGFPVTHDGQDHIARIANFYRNMSEGVLIPRWAGNLNWGYGHPILMFLYPFPSYLASFFHFIGFSFVNSTKLVFMSTYIASAVVMYLWVREFLDKKAGLIASLIYILAPYRFVDLYVRGAIGEHVAFIFPPMILYFLLKLSKKFSIWYFLGGSLSLALLILSHNAISLMFIPLILIYIAYQVYYSKDRKALIYQYTCMLVFGFGLSAFFWIPAFMEGKYTLRDIVTTKDYAERFVDIEDLFSLSWSYGGTNLLSKQIGLIHWVFIFWGIIMLLTNFIKDKKNIILLGLSLLMFFTSLYLMTAYSKIFWDNLSIVQKFQFPWRFLSLSVFLTALIGGIVAKSFPRKFSFLFCLITIISLLLANKDYWHAKGYLNKPESFFTSIYHGTTDTGESSPIWSVRFMERRANYNLEVIEGSIKIDELERKSTRHIYILDAKRRSRVRENTLYFPGWKVFVDKKQIPIEFQDPANRGLITFFVESGRHEVEIVLEDTKLRYLANLLSLFSLILLPFYGILINRKYVFPFNRTRHS